MTATAGRAVAERLEGRRPSRTKALVAAVATAIATGAVVYKLLRSGDDAEDVGGEA